jgi:hypothetical protein
MMPYNKYKLLAAILLHTAYCILHTAYCILHNSLFLALFAAAVPELQASGTLLHAFFENFLILTIYLDALTNSVKQPFFYGKNGT